MTPLSPEKYTVAWFTLAAFIARKEKERALGIYRLLTHSLHNEALAYQLEGDILLSFSDEKALSAYEKAAAFYEKQGAIVQAAAVYEHLVTLVPDYLDYAHKLVRLYISQSLNTQANAYISPHVRRALTHLATLYSNSLQRALSVGTSDQVELMIQEGIAPLVYDQHKAFVYAHIALSMSTNSIFINTILFVD